MELRGEGKRLEERRRGWCRARRFKDQGERLVQGEDNGKEKAEGEGSEKRQGGRQQEEEEEEEAGDSLDHGVAPEVALPLQVRVCCHNLFLERMRTEEK